MLSFLKRLARAPNKSLQRSGTHKVLGRGRPSQERTRALARPRAQRAACGRGTQPLGVMTHQHHAHTKEGGNEESNC
jgi:hypothetical protein